jgi:cytochrome c553
MKNIFVGVATLIIVSSAIWVASKGGAYNGGEHGKVIKDMGTQQKTAKIEQPKEKSNEEKERDKLRALREKAGNIGAFKVSDAYKSRCSSCHGVNGSGFQNGKKMMGPKLFGQSEDELYQKLADFKSGRKENVVMKGLLLHMSDDDLKSFAKEIGEFPTRAKAQEENR